MRTSTKFLCISAVLVIVALAMAPVVTRAVVPDLDVDPMFFEEDDTVLVQLNDPGAKGKPAADEQTQSQTQTTAPTSQSDTQTKSVPTDVEAKPEAGAPAPTAPTPSPPVESPPTEVKPEAEAPSSTPPSSTPPSPKPVLTKCKDPAYRGQNPDGSPKKRVGEVGVACQKTTVPCTGGRFEPGLCGGPNDLQCCLKTAAALKNSAAALKEAEAKKHAHASLEQKRQASEEHAKSSSASNAGRKGGSAVGSLAPKDSVKETTHTKETSVKPPPSSDVPPPSTSVKGALKGVQAVAKGKLGKVRMPTDLKTAKATPATELIANNMPGAMCQSFMQGSCVMKSTCASGNYATDSTMCPSRTQAPVCCFDKDIAGMPETPKAPPALVPTECPPGRTLCFLTADTVLTVTDGKVALDPSKVAQVKTAPLSYPDGSIITITDVKAAIEADPLVFGEGGVPAQVARITTKWTVTKKGTAFTDAKQTVFEEPDDVFYIDAAPKGVSGRVVGGMALQNLEQVFTVSPKGIVLKPGAVLTTPINVRTATVKVLGLVEGSSSYQKDRFAYEAKVRLEIVEPLLGFDAVFYGHNHIVKLTKGAIFTTEFAISSENLSAAAPSAASSPSTASPSAAAPPKRKVF